MIVVAIDYSKTIHYCDGYNKEIQTNTEKELK